MNSLLIENLGLLPQRIEQLIQFLEPLHHVWAFDAPMGAGKTTIIREICRQKKVVDVVTSPTFSIINEYSTETGEVLYHFDFYRLNSVNEALSIGVPDYFDSANLCLIEWPSVISPLLPPNYLQITITVNNDDSRLISWTIVQ